MAIELKQTLKLSQQLLITPQLQQAIKLLQLSRAELVETIQKELMENPVLEEAQETDGPMADGIGQTERMSDLKTGGGESPEAKAEHSDKNDGKEFDWASYIESTHSRQGEPRHFSTSTEDLPNYENILTRASTLQDHLEWQLHLADATEKEMDICAFLIGNIGDDGYLKAPLTELAAQSDYTREELEDALCLIQEFEPLGVGAQNLQECLLLQIKDVGADRKILSEIVKNHLHFLEKRDFTGLAKKLKVTPARAKELAHLIFSLDPKPGRRYGIPETHYVTPDVYVRKVGEDYVVILNEDGLPKLQISNFYKKAILKEVSQREKTDKDSDNPLENAAQNYIQEKLKNALWLIKSIHQRQKTLYKVTKSIVRFQRDFFEQGIQFLKPLVLREVADEIGVHESTVSRATSGKYVHTPQGIFELKYFFNTGISNAIGGSDFANETVKQMVKKVIDTEDPKAPLSDHAVAEMLKSQNMNIARRTVAKYREMLGILPSSKRKRLE